MDCRKPLAALEALEGGVLLGIDGMVDEVWELLKSRAGPNQFTKMARMAELGEAIAERRAGGLAKERLLKRRTFGGFTCNTGRATAALGLRTTLLGTYGAAAFDPVFKDLENACRMVSVGEPAKLHVLEFLDGKLMLPCLSGLIGLRWENLKRQVGSETLRELCDVDLIGIGYWSNLYDFEAIMSGLLEACLASGKTRRVFHDFANLDKRTPQALREALGILGRINSRLPQTLSLNEHEAGILARRLGIDYPGQADLRAGRDRVLAANEALLLATELDELVIHTPYFSTIATRTQGCGCALQDYCDNPVRTTGAGDTFNGGYITASLAGLSPTERLVAANAAARLYVQTGSPPTRAQLLAYLTQKNHRKEGNA